MKISGASDYILKTKIRHTIQEPLLEDDSREFECNTLIIQNPGNRMAITDSGWTIAPGGREVFGSENNDPYAKFTATMKFSFVGPEIGSACYDHDRLEFCEVNLQVCKCIPCKPLIKKYA